MIDFSLTDEQPAIQDLARRLAREEIRPVAAEYDDREEMPWPVLKKAARVGLLSYGLPEEYGGDGVPDGLVGTTNFLVTEELAWSNGWVLDGLKQFITNGGIADIHIVFARIPKEESSGCFIVEKGTAGLEMGRKERKLGMRASRTAEVVLDGCCVPAENRLSMAAPGGGGSGGQTGDAASGTARAQTLLQYSRMMFASAPIGLARAALEYARGYALEREVLGVPIARHQAVAFKLADMAMEIEAARALLWRAGWLATSGRRLSLAAGSMAKCHAAYVAVRATTEAVQILGGHGYVRSHPVEKWCRHAKRYQIWEGTNEIQRLVFSRALLGSRSVES